MINVGIIGATGYAGEVLIDILLRHPQVRIKSLYAKLDKPQAITEIFPRLKGRIELVCNDIKHKDAAGECDLVFLALPHTVSMEFVPHLLKKGKRVIDLSADYRLRDTKVYERYYNREHKDKLTLKKAVYGLPELYREKIKKAELLANPGCYPTAALLGIIPAVALSAAQSSDIIIDAKSGTTGAGRKNAQELLFAEVNEDFRAYKVNVHQHSPEIDQELSKAAAARVKTVFVPHLLPLNRGILETIYLKKNKNQRSKAQKLLAVYKKFYKSEPFVRVKDEGQFPKLKDVAGTNFCDIGIREEEDKYIIISAIDNLLKGASGQAVQNMNIMYGFPETAGLI